MHGRAGPLILVGDAFHNFVDGVVVAAAFLTSVPLGITAALAVIAHEIPQEVGDFAILLDNGYGRKRWYSMAFRLPSRCPALWRLISGSARCARRCPTSWRFLRLVSSTSLRQTLFRGCTGRLPSPHPCASSCYCSRGSGPSHPFDSEAEPERTDSTRDKRARRGARRRAPRLGGLRPGDRRLRRGIAVQQYPPSRGAPYRSALRAVCALCPRTPGRESLSNTPVRKPACAAGVAAEVANGEMYERLLGAT